MAVTMNDIAKLRKMTGAGMMDCKKALAEAEGDFDKAMVALLQKGSLQTKPARLMWLHQDDKVIIFAKGFLIFAFNFHPHKSFEGYFVPTPDEGKYKAVLSTDDAAFGGQDRLDTNYRYTAATYSDGRCGFPLYLPSRTAVVLKKSPR